MNNMKNKQKLMNEYNGYLQTMSEAIYEVQIDVCVGKIATLLINGEKENIIDKETFNDLVNQLSIHNAKCKNSLTKKEGK